MSSQNSARHEAWYIYENTAYEGLREYYICSRKKLFVWEFQAAKEAKLYGLDVYNCTYCSGFHMGHNASKKPPKEPGEFGIVRALTYGLRKERKRRKHATRSISN